MFYAQTAVISTIFFSTKLRPCFCTQTIYSLYSSEPNDKGSIQKCRGKMLYNYPKLTQMCLSSDPCYFDILVDRTATSTATSAMNILSQSFRTLGRRLFTKVRRAKCCKNIPKYFRPRNLYIFRSIKLKPPRCKSTIYMLLLYEVSKS